MLEEITPWVPCTVFGRTSQASCWIECVQFYSDLLPPIFFLLVKFGLRDISWRHGCWVPYFSFLRGIAIIQSRTDQTNTQSFKGKPLKIEVKKRLGNKKTQMQRRQQCRLQPTPNLILPFSDVRLSVRRAQGPVLPPADANADVVLRRDAEGTSQLHL